MDGASNASTVEKTARAVTLRALDQSIRDLEVKLGSFQGAISRTRVDQADLMDTIELHLRCAPRYLHADNDHSKATIGSSAESADDLEEKRREIERSISEHQEVIRKQQQSLKHLAEALARVEGDM
jgi:chromosome segregation ATPase